MKLTIIVSFVFLFVTPVFAGTLRDDFSDGDTEGWMRFTTGGTSLPNWHVENGRLVCRRSNGYGAQLVIGDVSWKDYTIECDVKLTEMIPSQFAYNMAGVVVYCNNGDRLSGYYFGDFQKAMSFWAYEYDHNFLFNQAQAFPISLRKWYRMKVEAKGKKYSLKIDGKKIHQFTGTRFESGRVGVGLGGAEAHFDNVIITGNDVPNVGPSGYAVHPKAKLTTTWGRLRAISK